jgi:hypothetical protein
VHDVAARDTRRQIAHPLRVYEDADVLTDAALFVDHAKAHAWVTVF